MREHPYGTGPMMKSNSLAVIKYGYLSNDSAWVTKKYKGFQENGME